MRSVSSAYVGHTLERNEVHLRSVDQFLGEDLADGECDFGLVFVLVADGDAVGVVLAAGRAEGVQQF